MAYQVILEPGIGRLREIEPPPSAYSYKFVGTFLVHKLTSGTRGSVSKQHSMKNRRAVGCMNPMRDKN